MVDRERGQVVVLGSNLSTTNLQEIRKKVTKEKERLFTITVSDYFGLACGKTSPWIRVCSFFAWGVFFAGYPRFFGLDRGWK